MNDGRMSKEISHWTGYSRKTMVVLMNLGKESLCPRKKRECMRELLSLLFYIKMESEC